MVISVLKSEMRNSWPRAEQAELEGSCPGAEPSRACAEGPASYCLAEPQTQINRSFFFPPKNSVGEGALIPQSWSLDPTLELCPQPFKPCLLDLCLGWHAQKLSLGPCCSDSPCTQLYGGAEKLGQLQDPRSSYLPQGPPDGGNEKQEV